MVESHILQLYDLRNQLLTVLGLACGELSRDLDHLGDPVLQLSGGLEVERHLLVSRRNRYRMIGVSDGHSSSQHGVLIPEVKRQLIVAWPLRDVPSHHGWHGGISHLIGHSNLQFTELRLQLRHLGFLGASLAANSRRFDVGAHLSRAELSRHHRPVGRGPHEARSEH